VPTSRVICARGSVGSAALQSEKCVTQIEPGSTWPPILVDVPSAHGQTEKTHIKALRSLEIGHDDRYVMKSRLAEHYRLYTECPRV